MCVCVCMCVCMCVCVRVCLYLSVYNSSVKVFFPRLVALSRLKRQSALLFTDNLEENNWIHPFSKAIRAM